MLKFCLRFVGLITDDLLFFLGINSMLRRLLFDFVLLSYITFIGLKSWVRGHMPLFIRVATGQLAS